MCAMTRREKKKNDCQKKKDNNANRIQGVYKTHGTQAGEKAQRLRAFAALPADQSLVLNTHV